MLACSGPVDTYRVHLFVVPSVPYIEPGVTSLFTYRYIETLAAYWYLDNSLLLCSYLEVSSSVGEFVGVELHTRPGHILNKLKYLYHFNLDFFTKVASFHHCRDRYNDH